jgi:hypothetical protein
MKTITTTVRKRIEAQGFTGLSDTTLSGINYGLRLAPALCMVWAAVGTALASPAVLWSLLPLALLGAILPGHPFDILFNFGLRRLWDAPRLPRYPKPRRFACALASLMLFAAALSFQRGWTTAGYLIGGSLAAAAAVNVTTGFCIPSFLYGLLFGKPSSSCHAARESEAAS